MSEVISDHVAQALARNLEQYKGKPRIEAILQTVAQGWQGAEDGLQTIQEGFSLDTAVGAQLDIIGRIVGQPRIPGQSDPAYRIRIKTRIIQNISEGEPEIVITVYSLLLSAPEVFLHAGGFASVRLSSPVAIGTQDMINTLYREVQLTLAVGVRLNALGVYSDSTPFRFKGIKPGFGFGQGLLATAYRNTGRKFRFKGVRTDAGGFGDYRDPLVGGVFI